MNKRVFLRYWLLVVGLTALMMPLTAKHPVILFTELEQFDDPDVTEPVRDYLGAVATVDLADAKAVTRFTDSLAVLMLDLAPADPRRVTWSVLRGWTFVWANRQSEAFVDLRAAVRAVADGGYSAPVTIMAYSAFSAYMELYQQYELAIDYGKRILRMLNRAELSPDERKQFTWRITRQVIRYFSVNNQPDSAYLYQQHLVRDNLVDQNLLSRSNAFNDGGIYLTQAGRYADAIASFDQGIALICPADHKYWQLRCVNIQESKAHPLIETGRYAEGMALLQGAYDTRKRYGKWGAAMQALAYQIHYSMQADDVAGAERIFEREADYFRSDSEGIGWNSYKLYRELAELYRRLGRDVEADAYEIQYLRYADENPRFAPDLADQQQLRVFLALHQEEAGEREQLRKLQYERTVNDLRVRNLWLGLVGALLLCGLIGFWSYRRLRVTRERKLRDAERTAQRLLQLENENLQLAVREKEKDLERIVAENRTRLAVRQQFLNRLDRLKSLPVEAVETELADLRQDLTDTDGEETSSLLREQLAAITSGFEDRLRGKVDGITPAEIRLCSLFRVGMNNRQVAEILDVDDEELRRRMFALRRKAGWTAGEMEVFLGEG